MTKDNYFKDEFYAQLKHDYGIFNFLQETVLEELLSWEIEHPEGEWMNAQFLKTLGYDPEEILQQPHAWQDLLYLEDVSSASENFKKHIADPHHPYDQVVRCRHKSGSVVYIRSRGIAIRDSAGRAIRMIGIHQNIIKERVGYFQENVTENFTDETFNYRWILDSMLEGCQILDFDLKYLYLNHRAEVHNQRPNTELLGKCYVDMWPGVEHTLVFARIKSCLEERKSYQFENRFVFPSGEVGWFDLDIQPINQGVFIQSIDITKKKLAEIRLKRSEKELQKVQKITHIGSWYLDIATNEVTWTEELYRMYGFDPTLPPPPYTEHKKLFADESWEQLSTSLENTRLTGEPYELELKTIKSDATNGWMWVRGEAVFDEHGSIIALWGAAQDISSQKSIEEELLQAKDKAEESDRLKTAFLQNMSHEIRTPLNAIKGFTSLLNEPDMTDEKRQYFSQIILNSSDQLISIVSDIMTIASLETRQEQIVLEKMSVNSLIVEMLAVFKQIATRQNVSLFSHQPLPEAKSIVRSDKTKVRQVLSNLISNALKFTHEGSVEFGYDVVDGMVRFFVKDTGVGIAPEMHQKIFERFRQSSQDVHKKYGGTGLGLSISQGFVRLLGGDIWVESEEGKGSVFYFTIPYNCETNSDKTTSVAGIEARPSVLVAEDEEYNFLYLEELLIPFDITVYHAKNGREAVDLFVQHPEVKLVLMDIKMPVLGGVEATVEIKKIDGNVPVVAQSAYALKEEYERFQSVFDAYLAKPIDGKDIKRVLTDYVLTAHAP